MRVGDGSGVNPAGESGSLGETSKLGRVPELPETGGKPGKLDPGATLSKIRGHIPGAVAKRAESVTTSPLSLLPFSAEEGSSSKVVHEIMQRIWGKRGDS